MLAMITDLYRFVKGLLGAFRDFELFIAVKVWIRRRSRRSHDGE